MKKWLALLLLVAGCTVTMTSTDPQKIAKAELRKAEVETKERIRQYKIILEEQQLIRDIYLLKVEVAKVQTENAPSKKMGEIRSMKLVPADKPPSDGLSPK